MRSVQLPDEIVAGLEAVAALDGTTVADLLGGAAVEVLAARYHAIQQAYVALRELDPDNGRATAAAAPVSRSGPSAPPAPAPAKKPPAKKATRRRRRGDGPRTCERVGCDRTDHKARGLCNRHYQRWKTGADPVAPDGTRSPALEEDDGDDEDTEQGGQATTDTPGGDAASIGGDGPDGHDVGPDDPEPAPRPDDAGEDGRQDAQPTNRAGDGPSSPASTNGHAPVEPIVVPHVRRPPPTEPVELDEDDPMCCQAARCRDRRIAADAKFCQHHTSQVPRLAEKIRNGPRPPRNPFDAACERLIAGVR